MLHENTDFFVINLQEYLIPSPENRTRSTDYTKQQHYMMESNKFSTKYYEDFSEPLVYLQSYSNSINN